MSFTVKEIYNLYVLISIKNARVYVGITNNLTRRLKQHNDGAVKSTKAYKPYKLALKEEYTTRSEAVRRERYLKTGIGRKQLQLLLNNRGVA